MKLISSALGLAAVLSMQTEAVPPNKNCCDDANNPAGCHAYTTHPPTSFDNCVGPIGVDCEGVPYTFDFSPVGKLEVNIVKPIDNGDGTVTVKTAVGSILHDLCCIKYPYGAFCTSTNYPFGQTLNLLGNADNTCACLAEWRKAAWNLIRGRYWYETFSKAPGSADLTFDTTVVRRSWLPTGSGTNYLSYKSTWGLTERKTTSRLCAPANTRLDCPNEDDNCKVPCFGTQCIACASGCTSARRRRWNKNGRDHANAGDSDYCCSGRFREVHWYLDGTRFGVCA